MRTILIYLLLTAAACAQTTLETLRTEYDLANAELELPLEQWRIKYLEQLDQLKTQAQTAGDLDQILAINQEVAGGGAEIDPQYSALQRLRTIYDSRRAQLEQQALSRRRQIMTAYRQQLIDLQTTLTQAGEIEQALAVKQTVTDLEQAMQSVATPSRSSRPTTAAKPRGNNQPGELVIEGSKEHEEQGEFLLPPEADGHPFVRVFARGNIYYAIDSRGGVLTRPDAHQNFKFPANMKPVIGVGLARHMCTMLHSDGTITAPQNNLHAATLPDLNDVVKVSGGNNIDGALRRSGELVVYGWDVRTTPFPESDLLKNVVDFAVADRCVIVQNNRGAITGLRPNGSPWDNPPEGLVNVVQIAASSDEACLFLTREGKIICWQAPPPPADLGPVRQIRAGSQMYAAQKPNGNWVVWGHEGIAANMNRALQKYGPLKDLDLGYRFFIGIK